MKTEKELEEFYDKVSKGYEDHNKRFCDELLEHFIHINLPKKKLRILDIGGGIGRFAIPLAKKGHNVVLSDISQGMLDKAKIISKKNKVKLEFVKESVTNLKNHKNSSFDIVLVVNAILDYCGDYNKAIKEIKRVLKPNGLVMGNVNNRFVYASKHELKSGDFTLFKKSMKTGDRHISWGGGSHWSHEFTLEELREAFKSFKRIKVYGIYNLLDKYETPDWLENKKKRKEMFDLQVEYANKSEYINNSRDFFFIARK
ncbi:class I SAM-dependent methyltransferase [Candidatus Woesearchaeota archaeon]|nr:class I SAM-dependent methyltransferase [Candidatus Woesearchaeota archaeon]MBW3022192.1 class I SAM-dependent methyltransferase [Candidatus Woesearchaeota archaeon]